jgi:hypothetical protein
VLLAFGMLTTPVGAEEVENPLFAHWSQFGVGSYAVREGATNTNGLETTMTMTVTLVELNDDQAVVETVASVEMAGQRIDNPAQQEIITAMIDSADALDFENPEGKIDEGEEALEIAGQNVDTRWVEIETDREGTATHGKTWLSQDVPGIIVKMDVSTSAPVESTMQWQVVEFEAK